MLCEMFMAMLLAVGVIGAPSAWSYSCIAGDNITASHYTLGGQVWVITGADGRLGYQVGWLVSFFVEGTVTVG